MADGSSPEFIALVNRSLPRVPHDPNYEVLSVTLSPDQTSVTLAAQFKPRRGSVELWDVILTPFESSNFELTDQALAVVLMANVMEWADLHETDPRVAAQGRRRAI